MTRIPANLDTKTKIEHVCPHCGDRLEAVSGEAIPKAGDISLCLHCEGLLIFGKNFSLRKPTEEEDKFYSKTETIIFLRMLIKLSKEMRKRKPRG